MGLDRGRRPWGGQPGVRQNRAEAQTYVEYGLNDRWTIFGQMGIERYALSRPQSSLYAGLDYSGLGLRGKLWSSGDWIVSGEATLFSPGAWSPTTPAQAGNTGGATDARLLAGYSFALGPAPGFFDFELGYRFRTAGPPDEVHADVTIGLKPSPGFLLMLQYFTVVSTKSDNPSFPFWRQTVMQASLVLPLWDRWSMQLAYFQSVLTTGPTPSAARRSRCGGRSEAPRRADSGNGGRAGVRARTCRRESASG